MNRTQEVAGSIPASSTTFWSSKPNPLLLLIFLPLCVYAHAALSPFFWDEEDLIIKNPAIHSWKNLPAVWKSPFLRDPPKNYPYVRVTRPYRPLTSMTFMADYSLWKAEPFGYHLTNLLLHLANVLLVFLLVKKLWRDENLAFLASLFFSIHPIHTEAVTYIPSRGDLLMSSLLLLSLLCLHRRVAYLFFLLSLLSKETAVVFPCFLLVWVGMHPRDSRLKLEKVIGLCLIGAAYLLVRGLFFGFGMIPSFFLERMGLRLLAIGATFVDYLKLLVWPIDLRFDRTAFLIPRLVSWKALYASATFAALGLGFLFSVKDRKLLFGCLWSFSFFLPASNLIPLIPSMAEHYFYLPSVGIFLIFSTLLLKLRDRLTSIRLQKITSFLVLGISLFFLIRTFYRNLDYADPLDLFEKTSQKVEDVRPLHYNLGRNYLYRGNLEGAEKNFLKVVAKYRHAGAYFFLGYISERKGRPEEAINFYQKAIQFNPEAFPPYLFLGSLYYRIDRKPELASLLERVPEAYRTHPAFLRLKQEAEKPR